MLDRLYTRYEWWWHHFNIKKINHDETYQKANAERNVLKVLEGDCETAVGAHAIVEEKNYFRSWAFCIDENKDFMKKSSGIITKELGKVEQILKTKSNNSIKIICIFY